MEVAHTQFLQDIPERIILRCPKCKSIYVDDGECESCGFRLGLDRLGDPLGERSYYAISESYLKEHSVFGIELPQLFYSKRKKDKYLRQLNFRFTILLDYFLSDRDCNQVRRRVFWSELKTITWKMVQLGVSHNGIADQVEKHQGHTEYRIVASEIINYLMDCGQMQL
ncbi:MAG: hypothetical protein KAG61_03600, partial [Bacteriovoracaceae bacterium]|nr:hypothetical protein [Bacteriovoracaceae bacterium]